MIILYLPITLKYFEKGYILLFCFSLLVFFAKYKPASPGGLEEFSQQAAKNRGLKNLNS
jgi:hypothetical protein